MQGKLKLHNCCMIKVVWLYKNLSAIFPVSSTKLKKISTENYPKMNVI